MGVSPAVTLKYFSHARVRSIITVRMSHLHVGVVHDPLAYQGILPPPFTTRLPAQPSRDCFSYHSGGWQCMISVFVRVKVEES